MNCSGSNVTIMTGVRGLSISDYYLNNTNGLFANGSLISEKALKSGPEVRIRNTILLFIEEGLEDVLARG